MKLLDYIRGSRKGKEAHRIEREAMSDPLLSDALKGFDRVKGNHAEQIEALQKQIAARAHSHQKKHYLRNWSAVACLLAGLFVGGYFLLSPRMNTYEVMMSELTEVNVELGIEPILEVPAPPMVAKTAPKATATKSPATSSISKDSSFSLAFIPPTTQAATADSKALNIQEPVQQMADELAQAASPKLKATSPTEMRIIRASIRGTDRGTITNIDSNFKLPPESKNLEVNHIGFNTVIIPADTIKKKMIVMNKNNRLLCESVLVGYAASKKATSATSKQSQPAIGIKAYNKYLKENLKRPTDGECNGIKGKVIVTFQVDSYGRPQALSIKQSLCPTADKEALRLVAEGPDWTQGNKQGSVTVTF